MVLTGPSARTAAYKTLKCVHFLGLICYSLYIYYTVLYGRQALSTPNHIQEDSNLHFTVTTTKTFNTALYTRLEK